MGYVRKTLKLVFDDPELEGLEVRARRLNIDQALSLAALEQLKGLTDTSPDVREKVQAFFDTLAGVITSWNLEEPADQADPDGPTVAVPVSPESLAAQDLGFLMAITDALQGATLGVSVPLGSSSPSGDPSLEASIPMDVLLPSQPS